MWHDEPDENCLSFMGKIQVGHDAMGNSVRKPIFTTANQTTQNTNHGGQFSKETNFPTTNQTTQNLQFRKDQIQKDK